MEKYIGVLLILFIFFYTCCLGSAVSTENIKLKDSAYYTSQGEKYQKANENDNALVSYKKSIQLDYNNTKAHVEIAKVYARLKEYDKAIEEFEISIKLDETLAVSVSPYLILIYLFKENTSGLKNILQSLQEQDQYVYGVMYGQIILARTFGMREIKNGFEMEIPFPNNEETDYEKISAQIFYLRKDNNIQEAINIIENFIDNDNTSNEGRAFAYDELGNINYEYINRVKGLEYLSKALSTFPNYIYWRQDLITKLISTQLYTKALTETEKILSIEPNNNFALLAHGIIYQEFGLYKKSIESWSKLKLQDKILFILVENDYNRLVNKTHN